MSKSNKPTAVHASHRTPAGDSAKAIYQQQVEQFSVTHKSGPLPPADDLQKYEAVCPGAAKSIIEMAEKEQGHRHAIETAVLQFQISDQVASRTERRTGQFCALAIGCVALGCSTGVALYATSVGATIVAGLIGTGGLGSLIMAFLIDHNRSVAQKPGPPSDGHKQPETQANK